MPTHPGLIGTLLMTTLAIPLAAPAAVCEAKSGAGTAALLELYTSEGCDSCPPADRWLSEIAGRGLGADRVVPLALHVDYWNYLGWTDRFSQAAFTERQRELARRANSRTVYTPAFVLSGREYRGWSRGRFESDLERINRQPARADIALHLERNARQLRVNGSAALKDRSAPAELFLAVYENMLSTEVRAGENRGRRLEHAYVVHRLIGPLAFDASGQARIRETLTLENHWKTADLGVAAFVQERNGVAIPQALALGVCP
jgi:hypothetical protein